MKATSQDIAHLAALYEGRRAFHGELHDHAASGGTSDGKRPLSHWLGAMEALQLDFAAILDHKQVRHMYLPEWEDGIFLGGTEPGTIISDIEAESPAMHYNMLFPGPKCTEELLTSFPEYEFAGGPEGHFIYPKFTRERFGELIDKVLSLGGFFVHPHPKQKMRSDDPLHYWFRDYTGIEVIYGSAGCADTAANYPLYLDLLAAGKRLYCCAGGDEHLCASDKALTTLYAAERKNSAYLTALRAGDFAAGPFGIQMCVGDTPMGGHCSFAGKRLVVAVGDPHRSVSDPAHTYRLDLIHDGGVAESVTFTPGEEICLAFDTEDRDFYRTEIYDLTKSELMIAMGNPIWNDR